MTRLQAPASDLSALRLLVWRALWDVDLVSVPDLFGPSGSALLLRGRREWEPLVALLEAETQKPALTGLEDVIQAETCIRTLGSSYVLTEFILAPLRLPTEELEAVVRLGALASFIGGVYDNLLDHTPALPLPLNRALLRRIAQGVHDGEAADGLADSPGKSLMATLIVEYFRRLHAIIGPKTNPHVLACLHRSILCMYEAETLTLPEHRSALTRRALRRKTALPFVVMGLPGWLRMPEVPPERYRRHLRWLYRVGAFFGLIDDVVDLPGDVASNQPSLVYDRLCEARYGPETGNAVARQIAHEGRYLLSEWEAMVGDTSLLARDVIEAMPTCLVSWLSSAKRVEAI